MKRVFVVSAFALYAAVILYPFRWSAPRRVENGARRTAAGWAFERPGLVRSTGAPDSSAGFSARLRVRPLRGDQSGPARILTISRDAAARNLTIGQQGRDLVVRLRSHLTNRNGIPEEVIAGVFADDGWRTIDVRLSGRTFEVKVDGGRWKYSDHFARAPAETWNAGYVLALGNEPTGLRPWLGEIECDAGLGGGLERPERYWAIQHAPRLVPFAEAEALDLVLNFFGFVPLGLALALAGWSRVRVLLWGGALSLCIELVQLGLVDRFCSTTDLLLNSLGALAGAVSIARPGRARARTDPSSPS